MKNFTVVLLAVFSVAFAGFADAASPKKKRTRNANRIGAYAVGAVGMSSYTNDQTQNEIELADFLESTGNPNTGIDVDTDDSGIGYQATFGYRFTRHFAAEIGLAQFGSLTSTARTDMDFGQGMVPVTLKLEFASGGPIVSAIGILPVNDRFEFFGRVGYIFASSEREFTSRVDGDSGLFGSAKGDSQNLVLGAGASFHFGQVYSARFEYMKLDELGERSRTGLEDLNILSLGVVVRF